MSAAVTKTPTVASSAGRPDHVAEGLEAGAQAAVEQDQAERHRADGVGRLHVVELEAERARLARQHADEQEHQQQRRAEAQRDQARQDAGQHQQRAEQDAEADGVERGHRARISLRWRVLLHGAAGNAKQRASKSSRASARCGRRLVARPAATPRLAGGVRLGRTRPCAAGGMPAIIALAISCSPITTWWRRAS